MHLEKLRSLSEVWLWWINWRTGGETGWTSLQLSFRRFGGVGGHDRTGWNLQIVICTYWKRWKDKSHITELKQRRKQEWAVVIIQKHYRRWQISRWLFGLVHNLPSESPVCREWPRTPAILKETSFLLRKLYHKWRVMPFETNLSFYLHFPICTVREVSCSVRPNISE